MESEQQKHFIGFLENKEYFLDSKIGHGATSEVYLSTVQKDSNRKLAIKILNNTNSSCKNFKAEELAMNNLNRLLPIDATEEEKEKFFINICKPRVVKRGLLKLKIKAKTAVNYIVMDYASKKDFFDFVIPKRGFEEKYARAIFKKMLDAVQKCHAANICHRDIKLENFVVDEKFNIKLCDFGFACEYKEINPDNGFSEIKELTENLGTKNYKAPEFHEAEISYDGSKVDIFALGVTLFGMKCCLFPFRRASLSDEVYQKIIYREYDSFWEELRKTPDDEFKEPSDEFKDLFLRMVAANPEERPSINEILNHSWLQKECVSDEELVSELSQRETN